MTETIYLDYNATAPLLPSVKAILLNALDIVGNPSSVHQLGRKCRSEIDIARKKISAAADASPKDITLTSGGTEANHLALCGLGISKDAIYASTVDHASVYKNILKENLIPVNANGQVHLDALEGYFYRPTPPKLVSVALANSETGIIQHQMKDLIDLCHRYDCLVHTDAVQAFGKIPLSFTQLNVDLMTLSAHKIGGPKGAGALISKPSLVLKAPMLGGGQEKGLRSGTENLLAIMGFGAAAEGISMIDWTSTRHLIHHLIQEIRAFNPNIKMNSPLDGLPNTLNFSTPGHMKDTQVIYMDLKGIAVSAGSACSSGKVEQSHVLKAMGIEETYIESAIRLSLGPTTPFEHIERFLDIWKTMQHHQTIKG